MNRFEKTSNDLTALAPKWSERGHLLAALPKHLADSQEAIKSQQNIDKEMTDLSLIASAWLKSQQQKELLEARLKRFKETAGYPSMASVLPIPAVVGITNKEQAMNNLDKAAAFGAMMGKRAAFTVATPTESRLIGGAFGTIAGGLGTAGYDWLRGTKENKLKRALMGAGLGGLTGVGLGHVASLINNNNKPPQPTDLDPDREFTPDINAPHLNVNTPAQRDLINHPRMIHPLAAAGAGQKLLTNEEGRRMAESLALGNPNRAAVLGNAKLLKLFENARERGMDDYNFNHGDIKNNSGAADMINEYFANSERKGESFPGRNTIPFGNPAEQGPGIFSLVGKKTPDFNDFNRE